MAKSPPPVYQLDGVQKRYSQRLVLNLPRLEVAQGEILALIGPSGAGKTTLLRLLLFLEGPSAGTIQFNGMPVPGSPPLALRRRLGAMFQRTILLDLSVRDNVTFGLRLRGRQEPTQKIEDLLERLGLRSLAAERARTLSGGEAQRVALARALAIDASVLLLDEPTANLDPYNVLLIEDMIREQRSRGVTIILATHNIFQARRLADRAVLLLEGNLIETGPPEALFTRPQDPRTRAFISGEMVY
ncbi:MAG: ATP-binding cassette domain-containing protein [Actinobacteria bacterium]|nr:ATP-binding cassette domain-containing protein [Actinomycetota bacterium]